MDSSAEIILAADDPFGYYSRPGLAYYLTADEAFDAGRGSHLNTDGHVEMDAGFMDGATRRVGALKATFGLALVALGLGASQVLWAQSAQPPQSGAAQAPAAQKEPEQRPVFRGGANFVRVDVFATKDGVPVEDLKAEDFEVAEDGDPQKVETFEFVKIQTGGDATTRVEPRTVRESREMVADPRARVFVLFLDTYHVTDPAAWHSARVRMPGSTTEARPREKKPPEATFWSSSKSVAPAHRELAQPARRRLALGHDLARVLVAQLVERERAARGDVERGGEQFGRVQLS